MPWNLLILPLLGGYYVLSRCNAFKYRQQRLESQRLIFDTVLISIILLATSFLICYVLKLIFPDFITELYHEFPLKLPFIGTTAVSLLLGIAFAEFGNLWFFKDPRDYIQKAINRVGNELELMLNSSFTDLKLIQFTLSSGKVYVGQVKELPIPSVTDYIRIIPFLSGYRDDKQQVVFTTHYLTVYESYINEGHIDDIEQLNVDLIITLDDVVTLAYFDIDMYERFNSPDGYTPPEAPFG